MSEDPEEEVTVLRVRIQQRGSSMSESCQVLNLKRESCEHLRWTNLEQVQHCTDLLRQLTQSRRRRERESKEKRENRRPILRKLCAALLGTA